MIRKMLTATGTIALLFSQAAFAGTPEQAVQIAERYVSQFPVPSGMEASKVSYAIYTYNDSMPEPSYVVSFIGPGSDISNSNPTGCDSNEFHVIVSRDTGKVIPEIRILYWGDTKTPFRVTYRGWGCNYDNGPGGGM